MGLMIHSLAEYPLEVERAYYIYLLDYGWHEPLGEAIYQNFGKIADLASRREAVVMRGIVGVHFADEVLSWHQVNGQPAEESRCKRGSVNSLNFQFFAAQAEAERSEAGAEAEKN
jgi:hypothetical protein